MRLALDTNGYRWFRDREPSIVSAVQEAPVVGLPIIVVGELHAGFLHGSRQRWNTEALTQFMAEARVQVLYVDDETASRYGEVYAQLKRAGKPVQQNDMWIAALCLQHRYTLATRDRGFEHVIGLSVLDF